MRLLHLSDTHGADIMQIPLNGIDVIVHSGDFQPTKGRRMGERIRPVAEVRYQERWARKNASAIAAWAGSRPFVFVPGNHDFFNPKTDFAMAGMDVSWLPNGSVTIAGVHFYGYRFVPYVDGEWSGELSEHDIAEHAHSFPDVDVLVTHAPPRGVLDYESGHHWGSTALANEYVYQREGRQPKVWLCGHVHAEGGRQKPLGRTLVVNSATTYQVIELEGS
jgi:Icc-related predicted phosphoesterase